MKAIKVTTENHPAISSALLACSGKATAHTYTAASEIAAIADAAERNLIDLLGAKKFAIGAVVSATSGKAVSNAYCRRSFGPRVATRIVLERRSTGWFLTLVVRDDIYQSGGGSTLTLTAGQDERAVKVLREQYRVAA